MRGSGTTVSWSHIVTPLPKPITRTTPRVNPNADCQISVTSTCHGRFTKCSVCHSGVSVGVGVRDGAGRLCVGAGPSRTTCTFCSLLLCSQSCSKTVKSVENTNTQTNKTLMDSFLHMYRLISKCYSSASVRKRKSTEDHTVSLNYTSFNSRTHLSVIVLWSLSMTLGLRVKW